MAGRNGVRELIDGHYESLYRYAYRLSGNISDAEDLTQESFSKAMARLHQLRDPERARSWLFGIVRNAYLQKMRDDRRHRVVPMEKIGDLPENNGPATNQDFDYDPAQVQEALNELDESFRTPLILFYFEDFSYRDIADQMQLPIGTVMSRLARAKAYLKVKLQTSVKLTNHNLGPTDHSVDQPAMDRENG